MLNGFGDAAAIETLRPTWPRKSASRFSTTAPHLSKVRAARDLVIDTEKRLGKVDILVNNAGIQHVARVENSRVDRWDAIIAINLSSAFHTSRKALPGMQARGFGRIINIGLGAWPGRFGGKIRLCAAKHGIVGLTKVVGAEKCRKSDHL